MRPILPHKPVVQKLVGKYVSLELFNVERDAKLLWERTNGSPCSLGSKHVDSYDAEEVVWRYMFNSPQSDFEAFKNSLSDLVNGQNSNMYIVNDLESNTPVGAVGLINNFPQHLKIEMGNIFYSPLAQRTWANTEATYLVLKYLFSLGYRRVEWKCDSLNQRSRQAALKNGFTFEGIQEYHFIIKDKNRDTAWFRILDKEWESVKQHLEKRLSY